MRLNSPRTNVNRIPQREDCSDQIGKHSAYLTTTSFRNNDDGGCADDNMHRTLERSVSHRGCAEATTSMTHRTSTTQDSSIHHPIPMTSPLTPDTKTTSFQKHSSTRKLETNKMESSSSSGDQNRGWHEHTVHNEHRVHSSEQRHSGTRSKRELKVQQQHTEAVMHRHKSHMQRPHKGLTEQRHVPFYNPNEPFHRLPRHVLHEHYLQHNAMQKLNAGIANRFGFGEHAPHLSVQPPVHPHVHPPVHPVHSPVHPAVHPNAHPVVDPTAQMPPNSYGSVLTTTPSQLAQFNRIGLDVNRMPVLPNEIKSVAPNPSMLPYTSVVTSPLIHHGGLPMLPHPLHQTQHSPTSDLRAVVSHHPLKLDPRATLSHQFINGQHNQVSLRLITTY